MRLPDQIPYRVAMELALTGNFLDVERAMALGLINRISEGPAIEGAMALAREITDNGPAAVRVSKQIISESRGWPQGERWERQDALLPEVFKSPDAREGAAAFAEKRKPNWTGQ
jgi:enoyl-CoA hydratase